MELRGFDDSPEKEAHLAERRPKHHNHHYQEEPPEPEQQHEHHHLQKQHGSKKSLQMDDRQCKNG